MLAHLAAWPACGRRSVLRNQSASRRMQFDLLHVERCHQSDSKLSVLFLADARDLRRVEIRRIVFLKGHDGSETTCISVETQQEIDTHKNWKVNSQEPDDEWDVFKIMRLLRGKNCNIITNRSMDSVSRKKGYAQIYGWMPCNSRTTMFSYLMGGETCFSCCVWDKCAF